MRILGIETSCDETSCAVVEMEQGRRKILSNIVASQIDIHRRFGGVVPEVAGRAHIETISRITYEALEEARLNIKDIDAVGVTYAPGLIGALLVGVNFAKSLAFSKGLPLIPVHHIRAHIAAAYLAYEELIPPFLAVAASGGHTSIIDVTSYTEMKEIGFTRDDAAGEAFDKVGRVMGLPYPGGAAMDKLAAEGNGLAISFPSPAIPGDTLEFSFSGLKTAVINYLHTCEMKGFSYSREDVAASFTHTVTEAIMKKTETALRTSRRDKLVFVGGVAANTHIRRAFSALGEKMDAKIYIPPVSLCGDNAAMVGAQAYYEYLAGNVGTTSLNASANA